jgi:hypothetical protein
MTSSSGRIKHRRMPIVVTSCTSDQSSSKTTDHPELNVFNSNRKNCEGYALKSHSLFALFGPYVFCVYLSLDVEHSKPGRSSLRMRLSSVVHAMRTQLRWAGHVSRMDERRLPKIVLFGELSTGHRNVGAPKRYIKTLKSPSACMAA